MVHGRLEIRNGAITHLVVDGHDLRATGIDTPAMAVEALQQHAQRTGGAVTIDVTGDPSEVTSTPGQVVFHPDGTWGPTREVAYSGGLTHADHEAIPPGLDLFSTPAPTPPAAPAPTPTPDTAQEAAPTSPPEEPLSSDALDYDAFFTSPEPTPTGPDSPSPRYASTHTPEHPPTDEPAAVDDTPETVETSFFDDFFTHPGTPTDQPAPTVTSPPAEPVDALAMSRSELESWVSAEVLNPERATVGEGSIRTRSETPALRKPIVLTAALGVAAVCLVGLVVTVVTDDPAPTTTTQEAPKVGPYALQTVDLTVGSDTTAWVVPGYEETWTATAAKGASVAALTHAVVMSTPTGLTFLDTADGTTIGSSPVTGRIDAVLTATLPAETSDPVEVVAWKQGSDLSIYLLDQQAKPLRRLALPDDATISSRGTGLLVTTDTQAGLVSLDAKRKPLITWFESPVASAEGSSQTAAYAHGVEYTTAIHTARREPTPDRDVSDVWAYAASPGGDVWWLGDDGTVYLPAGQDSRAVSMVQPRAGVRFSGWVGASLDGPAGTTRVLVAAWLDPATKKYHLVTHNPRTGEPVNAVEASLSDVQAGVTGVRSTHLAVGPFLIDAASGKIVVNGGEDYRFITVAGDIASVRTPDGTVGMVNLTWIRADRELRVQATESNLLGADSEGTAVVQMPGSVVAGYAAPAE